MTTTIRIDLYGEGKIEDAWEGIFADKTEKEVLELFNDYDKKYKNDLYDGTWEDYLQEKEVEYKLFNFDYDDYL